MWDLDKLLSFSPPAQKSKVVIRDARPEEMAEVIDVWQVALENTEGNSWAGLASWLRTKRQSWIDGFKEELSKGSFRVLIAEIEGKIVGISGLQAPSPKYGEDIGGLATGVCILPQYRRQGIGASLLFESLLALKNSGMRFAAVSTVEGTVASRFLYPKFGGYVKARVK